MNKTDFENVSYNLANTIINCESAQGYRKVTSSNGL